MAEQWPALLQSTALRETAASIHINKTVMMQKVALFGAKIGREDYSSRSLFLATFP
jgi:hypothetical protein